MPTPSAPPNTVSSVRSKPIACSAISTPTTSSSARTNFASTARTLVSSLAAFCSRCSTRPDSHRLTASVRMTATMPFGIVEQRDVLAADGNRQRVELGPDLGQHADEVEQHEAPDRERDARSDGGSQAGAPKSSRIA